MMIGPAWMPGNANSGRRPKYSDSERQVLGFPPSRRNPNEPKPPSAPIVKPGHLSQMASEVWDEMAPECEEMGTLTAADTQAFATMCELESTRRHASKQKDAEGWAMFTMSEDYNGAAKVGIHAAIKVEGETAVKLRPYYEQFGKGGPSSRARLRVGAKKPEQPVSKWAGEMA